MVRELLRSPSRFIPSVFSANLTFLASSPNFLIRELGIETLPLLAIGVVS